MNTAADTPSHQQQQAQSLRGKYARMIQSDDPSSERRTLITNSQSQQPSIPGVSSPQRVIHIKKSPFVVADNQQFNKD